MMENRFELVEIKVCVVLAKEVATLYELTLDVFDVTSGSERLPVSIFLVALDACRLAGSAARML